MRQHWSRTATHPGTDPPTPSPRWTLLELQEPKMHYCYPRRSSRENHSPTSQPSKSPVAGTGVGAVGSKQLLRGVSCAPKQLRFQQPVSWASFPHWIQQPLLPGKSERRNKPRVSEEQLVVPTVTFRSQEVCCQELGGEPSRPSSASCFCGNDQKCFGEGFISGGGSEGQVSTHW